MRIVEQKWGDAVLRHELFAGPRSAPCVILFPTVMGVSDLERGFAARLVEQGYAAVVADLYGRRFAAAEREAAFAAMGALQADRGALRGLLVAQFEEVLGYDEIDPARVAAVGFCFGGQCALDLARAGVQVTGIASFHGLFDPPDLAPQPIRAKVAAYHGWDDPLVTPEAVVALGRELTKARCDWQIHAYGNVGHAFTNPGATGAMPGIKFDAQAARRAWRSCDDFLRECFE